MTLSNQNYNKVYHHLAVASPREGMIN